MTDSLQTPTSTPITEEGQKISKVTVVPFPKIVFFYPCFLLSLLCGIFTYSNPELWKHFAGMLFLIIFLINVMIISFDFPGIKALALALFVIAVFITLLWLDDRFNILGFLGNIFKALSQEVEASAGFYFMISLILGVMIFGGVLVNVLWNRWTVYPNRLEHKHGLLGDVTEYPVIDLQVRKKIEDVFEYCLLFSGSLTFIPNPTTPPILLENVPLINRVEKKIQRIVRKQ